MALEISTKDIKFLAKGLASDEKQIRFKSISVISKILIDVENSIDYTQTLFICKALFYALWQQDKLLLQEDVVKKYVSIISKMKDDLKRSYYISAWFETLAREWITLDKHRVDKFMMLLRDIFVKSLQTSFTEDRLDSLLQFAFEKILNSDYCKAAELKLFFADVFVEEFSNCMVSVRAIFTSLELVTKTILTLPKGDPYTEKLTGLAFSLVSKLEKSKKVNPTRLLELSDNFISLIEKYPSYHKRLSMMAKRLKLIYNVKMEQKYMKPLKRKLSDDHSQSQNDILEQGGGHKRMKKHGIKHKIISHPDEIRSQPAKLHIEHKKLEVETQGKPNKTLNVEEPDESKKRVTFGKIFRKRFKVSRRLSTPSVLLAHPQRGILRKSL